MDKRPMSLAKLRRVPRQCSWVDRRLVRDRSIDRLSHEACALALCLVTVADAQGLSYYADPSLGQRLSLTGPALQQARQGAIGPRGRERTPGRAAGVTDHHVWTFVRCSRPHWRREILKVLAEEHLKVALSDIGFVLGVTAETVLEWMRRAAQKAYEINAHLARIIHPPVKSASETTCGVKMSPISTLSQGHHAPKTNSSGHPGVRRIGLQVAIRRTTSWQPSEAYNNRFASVAGRRCKLAEPC
jgi:hypothetical protein